MPFYAVVDGERTRATKDGARRASCHECGAAMLAKTGEVVSWHWAHLVENPHCEAARESLWHLGWKATADHQGVEVAVGNRRADVLTPYGYAVEVQKSALTGEEVRQREEDWKGKLIWIFLAQEAYERPEGLEFWAANSTYGKVDWGTLQWKRGPDRVKAARCWSLLDVGRDNLIFVGEWTPKSSPLRGYGWSVPRSWVIDKIINGTELPERPGLERPDWAPSVRQARADRKRRDAERLRIKQALWEADRAEREGRVHAAADWQIRAEQDPDIARARASLARMGITTEPIVTRAQGSRDSWNGHWRPTVRWFVCAACGDRLEDTGDLDKTWYKHAKCGGRFMAEVEEVP